MAVHPMAAEGQGLWPDSWLVLCQDENLTVAEMGSGGSRGERSHPALLSSLSCFPKKRDGSIPIGPVPAVSPILPGKLPDTVPPFLA